MQISKMSYSSAVKANLPKKIVDPMYMEQIAMVQTSLNVAIFENCKPKFGHLQAFDDAEHKNKVHF